ncbi:MAG: CheR family methyltransferase, partial [Leptospirales bacterium]
LPEIIAARRKAGDLRLRIWSAGCSTGEEPYSLAALLYDLLPDAQDWRLLILGTDPNESAVERARSGRYTNWSFRQVSEERRSRFFTEESGTRRILPGIQSMVSFRVHDLHTAVYPEPEPGQIRDMDLIVCRNVFIYLQPAVIAQIVARLERTLVVGGMLVTGHGELSEARPANLATRVFPASILYQKESAAPPKSPGAASPGLPPSSRSPTSPGDRAQSSAAPPPGDLSPPSWQPTRIPNLARPVLPADASLAAARAERAVRAGKTAASPDSNTRTPGIANDDVSGPAREAITAGRYAEAVTLLVAYRKKHTDHEDSGYLLARAYANLGRHEEAALVLNLVLQKHPFGVRGYFLLAQISEEQGDPLRAMDLLKRSIYVDAAYIPGYLELGLLYEREGEAGRARRMLTSALELLKGLPPGTEIEEYNGESAAHLIERVEASL